MSLRLTNYVVKKIEENLIQAVSQREIMAQYGFGHRTIKMIAKNANIPITKGNKEKQLKTN